MTHGQAKASRAHWAIMIAAMLLLFVAFDFGLAVFFVDGIAVVPNKYFHHGLKANLSTSSVWGAAHYPIATNNFALKDREPRQLVLDDGHPRLLFLGDSFTEGVGFPYEKTFVGLIDDHIRRSGSDIEVLNGGVISHSPYLYYLHLKDLVERLHVRIDEVVVFIDVSDIQDELVYEDFQPGVVTMSLAIREAQLYCQQYSLTCSVLFTRLPALRPVFDAMRSWMRSVSRASGSVPKPEAVQGPQARVPAKTELVTSTEAPLVRPSQSVWDNANFYAQRDAWIDHDSAFQAWGRYGLHLARINLERLVQFAAGHHIKVSFAIYPWPRFAQTRSNRAREAWRKIAADEHWTLVDLHEDFADTPDAAKTFYIAGDVHWNERGHAFVAEHWVARYCRVQQAAWCKPTDR
jgi:lysophospholipase L1-like esterase